MKDLFESDDYRSYLHQYLESLPSQGYGQLAKIARALSLNPSTITLVLQGQKDFTSEQANDLCEYLEMTDLESDYFMTLVSLSRAGKPNLQARLQKQLSKIRERSKEVRSRIPEQVELDDDAKAAFYSQWYFSGVRLLTSIDQTHSPEAIAQRLQLPRSTVKRVLEFLVSTGLCVEKNGEFHLGPQSTHLGPESPHLSRHHQNWRLKSIEKSDRISKNELMFTCPASISKADFPEVRKVLMNTIEDCFKIIKPSPCEELACLNIDWFKI